ncbi:RNA polymerase sigma factor [Planctomycetota bacterium]|nr:RNA polymerase sigma factor [Planctomycetota bacterium]
MADDGRLIDPDAELVRRIAGGDDDAFRTLFDRHYRLAYSVIYKHIGVQTIAEDLVQEAFLRVYKAAPRYEAKAKFSTWFYTVVTNLCLNYKRDKARDRLRLVSGAGEDGANLLEQLASSIEHNFDQMEQQERSDVIKAAIQELPEKQRMALILSRYEDKSYEEIAKIMDITEAAVKSLNSRARATLKEKLQPWFDQQGE